MLEILSRYVFYPLWDVYDRSAKLAHLRQLERSQWHSPRELGESQWQKLLAVVKYAYDTSPFYRKRMNDLGLAPADIKTPEDFRRLPITTKQDVRNHRDDFLANGVARDTLETAKTGGSTGVSLELYFDKKCQEHRNAAALRADRWAGWQPGMKRAGIWGNPAVAVTLKQKLRSALLDRVVYLDTMALNEHSMGEFVARWRAEGLKAIFGHAHSIYIFARFLKDRAISDLRPQAIIATSMMLLQHERDTIELVFDCKVTNRYGCEEVGLIACECEQHNGMHLNTDHLYVEFIREDGQPAAAGEPGKIVLTDFINRSMPLLRYRIEDVGVYSDRICACGRGLPIMERVEGRVADFLRKPDGTLVAGVSLVERTLTKIRGIEQMQLVQNSLEELVVNRVRGAGHAAASDQALIDELREVFGSGTNIAVNDVERIPQERSGKYRFSICRIV